MKRISLLIASLLISAFVFAQSYNFQHILNKVNRQSDLTDAQRTEILALSSQYYPKAMEIQNSKASDEVKYAKAMVLKKKLDVDLKKILTKDQYKRYQKICDDYEKKYKARMKQ